MIKHILKRVLPKHIVAISKSRFECFEFFKIFLKIKKCRGNVDLLIGSPIHSNLGDHLITLSEFSYLSDIGLKKELMDVPMEMFHIFKNQIKKNISDNSTIFINGGGWMGELWPDDELSMQEIVKIFSNHKIIVFPQTIYYEYSDFKSAIAMLAEQEYNSAENLYLFMRDRNSYEYAKEHYMKAKIYLCPDITISFKYDNHLSRVDRIGYCLREDREKCNHPILKDIIKLLEELNYKGIQVSTISNKRVNTKNRKKVVMQKLNEFAQCKLIITDRLHGMLFSYITHTPCIVFDNKTKKVSGTYYCWLKNVSNILFVDKNITLQQVRYFINRVKNNDFELYEYYIDMFSELEEVILND